MDVMLDTAFWGDVGIAVALRLTLAALVLWSLKLIWERRLTPAVKSRTMTRGPERASTAASSTGRLHTLRTPPTESVDKKLTNAAVTTDRPSRDRMRQELLAYLEQRAAGRSSR